MSDPSPRRDAPESHEILEPAFFDGSQPGRRSRLRSIRDAQEDAPKLEISPEQHQEFVNGLEGSPPLDWEGPNWPSGRDFLENAEQALADMIGSLNGLAATEGGQRHLPAVIERMRRDAKRLRDHVQLLYPSAPPPQAIDDAPTNREDTAAKLVELRRWVVGLRPSESAEPKEEPTTRVRSKRSTARGDARTKIIAALTKHHGYAGGCLNYSPIGVSELARQAGAAKSSVSAFFNKEFGSGEDAKDGYVNYKKACHGQTNLLVVLKMLSGNYSVGPQLFGRNVPGKDERGDE